MCVCARVCPLTSSNYINITMTPPPRSGPVCRAVLAAAWAGGPEAGLRGTSSPAAQHRPRRSRGRHPVQDGVPPEAQVRSFSSYLGSEPVPDPGSPGFVRPGAGLTSAFVLSRSSSSSSQIGAVLTSSGSNLEAFKAYSVFKEIENHLRQVTTPGAYILPLVLPSVFWSFYREFSLLVWLINGLN